MGEAVGLTDLLLGRLHLLLAKGISAASSFALLKEQGGAGYDEAQWVRRRDFTRS